MTAPTAYLPQASGMRRIGDDVEVQTTYLAVNDDPRMPHQPWVVMIETRDGAGRLLRETRYAYYGDVYRAMAALRSAVTVMFLSDRHNKSPWTRIEGLRGVPVELTASTTRDFAIAAVAAQLLAGLPGAPMAVGAATKASTEALALHTKLSRLKGQFLTADLQKIHAAATEVAQRLAEQAAA